MMISILPKLKRLEKEIGDKYRICIIDFEPCLYRTFGNGFNVEVSGCNTTKRKTKASLYLWFGEGINSIQVKSVHDIERTANAIDKAVEELYTYSQRLLEQGYNNRDKIFDMIWSNKHKPQNYEPKTKCIYDPLNDKENENE